MSWPAIRAALIAVVVLYGGLLAIPTPRPMTHQLFRAERAQSELHEWLPFARDVGIAEDLPSLERWVVKWSQYIDRWRYKAINPIRPFLRITRTGQRWTVFSTPSLLMHQFQVRVRRGAGWETVYARNDPDKNWLSGHLDQRRMRTIYEASSRQRRPQYAMLGRWLADRLFAEDPTITSVRIGQLRWRAANPNDTTEPKWVLGLTYHREAP